MTFDGNDQTADHGGDSRTGNKSMAENDGRVLLEIWGSASAPGQNAAKVEHSEGHDNHEACEFFKKLFSILGPEEHARETIIWQLSENRDGNLQWHSSPFAPGDLKLPESLESRLRVLKKKKKEQDD